MTTSCVVDGYVGPWMGIISSGWFVAAARRPGTCWQLRFPAEPPGSARSPTRSSRCPGFSGTAPLGCCSTDNRSLVCTCDKEVIVFYRSGYVMTLTLFGCCRTAVLSFRWWMQPEWMRGQEKRGWTTSLLQINPIVKLGPTDLILMTQKTHPPLALPILHILHPIHIWRYWSISARRASSAWSWDWQGNHQRPEKQADKERIRLFH